jgi:alkane 1-monooxygenase
MTGTIGINYAHELMYQPRRGNRWLADILMAMVLYSHFRSKHLLEHHRYVGTPRDAVTARYNENVHRFFIRVLKASYRSAFRTEAQRLTRQGLAWYDLKNPFWICWVLQLLTLGFAYGLAGFGVSFYFLFRPLLRFFISSLQITWHIMA